MIGVGQIAVMRNSDLPFGAINRQRLGISQVGRTGGRITSVANRKRSNEVMQNISAENLGNQAHAFVSAELFAVRGHNPRALLPAMLQSIEPIICEFRGIGMPINAEHTAIMLGILLHLPASNGR